MPLSRKDVLTLSAPKDKDIIKSVRYAIKSIPHTYDRMEKVTWKRAARIARGKVNELLLLPALRAMGLRLETKNKSYRAVDFNDFVLLTRDHSVDVDLKTFHVLDSFVKEPRKPISPARLVASCDHTGPWQDFYPMLVPADYEKPKDLFIFAVSVEYDARRGTAPVLPFSWLAFPETINEKFLINATEIKRREDTNSLLSARLTWLSELQGWADVVFERKGEARQKPVDLTAAKSLSLKNLSSLVCVALDDKAKESLSRSRSEIGVKVSHQADRREVLSTAFDETRFREIFTRGRYELHLLGWLSAEEFTARAITIPRDTLCYFYPPRVRSSERHAPGTKTINRYILPQSLNPISTLPVTFS
jgi:hypothetical protein